VTTSDEIFAELSDAFGATTIDDPWDVFAEKRRTTPVMEGDIMAEFGLPSFAGRGGERPVYSLFRYDDLTAALKAPSAFSSSIWLETFEPLAGRVILGLDGEEHRKWRGLLLPVFTRKAVESWEEAVVRPLAEQGLEELQDGKRADLVKFAQRFPVRMIYAIIGLSDAEGDYERFQSLALQMMLGLSVESDPEKFDLMMERYQRAMKAAEDLWELVLPVVQKRRAEGADGDDLISHMINAEFEGGHLDDEQIAGFLRALLVAATENVTRMFLNTATLLLERPELLERVREDRSLLAPVTAEAERYESPIGILARITTRDVEVGDTTIPEGAAVILVMASGNRDESVFSDPDSFEPGREEAAKSLSFGAGRHSCPGMNIARAEITNALNVLLDKLPNLRLDPDAEAPRIVGVHARGPATLCVAWD
jgi:cytochrome P450